MKPLSRSFNRARSFSESSKSKTSAFAASLDFVTDFGITIKPRSMAYLIRTCADVFPYDSPMDPTTGSKDSILV